MPVGCEIGSHLCCWPPMVPVGPTPRTLPRPRAALCRALAALDHSLRRRGSALVLRMGRWEEQLPALAAELGASGVLAEQEVETGAPAAPPLSMQLRLFPVLAQGLQACAWDPRLA